MIAGARKAPANRLIGVKVMRRNEGSPPFAEESLLPQFQSKAMLMNIKIFNRSSTRQNDDKTDSVTESV
jgi:hypothetical protein